MAPRRSAAAAKAKAKATSGATDDVIIQSLDLAGPDLLGHPERVAGALHGILYPAISKAEVARGGDTAAHTELFLTTARCIVDLHNADTAMWAWPWISSSSKNGEKTADIATLGKLIRGLIPLSLTMQHPEAQQFLALTVGSLGCVSKEVSLCARALCTRACWVSLSRERTEWAAEWFADANSSADNCVPGGEHDESIRQFPFLLCRAVLEQLERFGGRASDSDSSFILQQQPEGQQQHSAAASATSVATPPTISAISSTFELLTAFARLDICADALIPVLLGTLFLPRAEIALAAASEMLNTSDPASRVLEGPVRRMLTELKMLALAGISRVSCTQLEDEEEVFSLHSRTLQDRLRHCAGLPDLRVPLWDAFVMDGAGVHKATASRADAVALLAQLADFQLERIVHELEFVMGNELSRGEPTSEPSSASTSAGPWERAVLSELFCIHCVDASQDTHTFALGPMLPSSDEHIWGRDELQTRAVAVESGICGRCRSPDSHRSCVRSAVSGWIAGLERSVSAALRSEAESAVEEFRAYSPGRFPPLRAAAIKSFVLEKIFPPRLVVGEHWPAAVVAKIRCSFAHSLQQISFVSAARNLVSSVRPAPLLLVRFDADKEDRASATSNYSYDNGFRADFSVRDVRGCRVLSIKSVNKGRDAILVVALDPQQFSLDVDALDLDIYHNPLNSFDLCVIPNGLSGLTYVDQACGIDAKIGGFLQLSSSLRVALQQLDSAPGTQPPFRFPSWLCDLFFLDGRSRTVAVSALPRRESSSRTPLLCSFDAWQRGDMPISALNIAYAASDFVERCVGSGKVRDLVTLSESQLQTVREILVGDTGIDCVAGPARAFVPVAQVVLRHWAQAMAWGAAERCDAQWFERVIDDIRARIAVGADRAGVRRKVLVLAPSTHAIMLLVAGLRASLWVDTDVDTCVLPGMQEIANIAEGGEHVLDGQVQILMHRREMLLARAQQLAEMVLRDDCNIAVKADDELQHRIKQQARAIGLGCDHALRFLSSRILPKITTELHQTRAEQSSSSLTITVGGHTVTGAEVIWLSDQLQQLRWLELLRAPSQRRAHLVRHAAIVFATPAALIRWMQVDQAGESWTSGIERICIPNADSFTVPEVFLSLQLLAEHSCASVFQIEQLVCFGVPRSSVSAHPRLIDRLLFLAACSNSSLRAWPVFDSVDGNLSKPGSLLLNAQFRFSPGADIYSTFRSDTGASADASINSCPGLAQCVQGVLLEPKVTGGPASLLSIQVAEMAIALYQHLCMSGHPYLSIKLVATTEELKQCMHDVFALRVSGGARMQLLASKPKSLAVVPAFSPQFGSAALAILGSDNLSDSDKVQQLSEATNVVILCSEFARDISLDLVYSCFMLSKTAFVSITSDGRDLTPTLSEAIGFRPQLELTAVDGTVVQVGGAADIRKLAGSEQGF